MFRNLITDLPWPEKHGSRTAIGPMPGATSSAAIAELADQGRPLIVLTASLAEAHTLERELPLFLSVDTPGPHFARLGNPSLRSLFTAPRHRLTTASHALRAPETHPRDRAASHHDRDAADTAPALHRRQHA